ncbi:hypothetical protein [Photobacterium sp. OFAV2-7]|uniref:hypothetical protein n=1 Tax=Photobacterium sp. OFAV2-7 TaxID=2917748 RepID=UPI001EF4E786|nr:hypothetical protein [Photobacterium sp. OFAV2-7]MCG7588281.1 hypothetical protein [Photobacterium sp. OFAV2-7]
MKKYNRVRTNGGRLKSLQVERRQLIASIKISTPNFEKQRLQSRLDKVIAEIDRLQNEPVVSEHAMLRYLERIKGLDLEALENEILNEPTRELINSYGVGHAKLPHRGIPGCRLIVNDKTIVTVELTR